MTIPLIVLAIFSAVAGFIGIPEVIRPHSHWLEHWLQPVVRTIPHGSFKAGHTAELSLMLLSSIVALAGIWFAFSTYRQLKTAETRKNRFAAIHQTLTDKWYIDELYEASIVRPLLVFSQSLWKKFDVAVIDRAVVGFGLITQWGGQTLRLIQTGSVQIYLMMTLIGLVAAVGYLVRQIKL
jgi:NADH-quinone oxidoreductase subunit L